MLNVLVAALFNRDYVFEGHVEKRLEEHRDKKSYECRDSLSTILESIIQILIFGEEGLTTKRWLSKSWKKAADAMDVFRSYLLGFMEDEQRHVKEGRDDDTHLVARLVRAREEDQFDEKIYLWL
jgi:cytochrome P450